MAVKHSTSSDATFSAPGATAWDASHTVDDNTLVAAKLSAASADVLFGALAAGAGIERAASTIRWNAVCNGRLTTESGVPVSSADRTAQGTLYFTPYNGNQIATYNGTVWSVSTFAEKSLALTVTSGKNYDVFIVDSTLALELSAAWTNDSTRADALVLQDGVYVKSGTTTRRWLGTIRASGANVTEDSAANRYVSNVYNTVPRAYASGTGASHTYATNVEQEWNGGTTPPRATFILAAGQDILLHGVFRDITSVAVTIYTMNCSLDGTSKTHCFDEVNTTNVNNAHYRIAKTYAAAGYHYTSMNENVYAGTENVDSGATFGLLLL